VAASSKAPERPFQEGLRELPGFHCRKASAGSWTTTACKGVFRQVKEGKGFSPAAAPWAAGTQ